MSLGGIEWEKEGREEAPELDGVFCCFQFSRFGCSTVLDNFPGPSVKTRYSLLCMILDNSQN